MVPLHFVSTTLGTLVLLGLFPFYIAVAASASAPAPEHLFNVSIPAFPQALLVPWSTSDFSEARTPLESFDKRQTRTCTRGPGGPRLHAVELVNDAALAIHAVTPVKTRATRHAVLLAIRVVEVARGFLLSKKHVASPASSPASCISASSSASVVFTIKAPYVICVSAYTTFAVVQLRKHLTGCLPGEICERNRCIRSSLRTRIVRFNTSDDNIEVLKNMCQAMLDTANAVAAILTYRGPDLDAISRTREAAGCNEGYCADRIAKGLVPPSYTSCVEYPPASSMEGGLSTPASRRSISCVPDRQNLYQGGMFSWKLNKDGISLQAGDQFVISVECDKVSIDVPAAGETPSASGENGDPTSEHGIVAEEIGVLLSPRDEESVSKSGNEAVEPNLLNEDEPERSFLIAPFGDLKPGTYTANIQVVNGSALGGTVLDNEGVDYARYAQRLRGGT
ncbi:hypothetical protein NLJ89_g8423 [Agrocybe chaxingu]|uniref:Deoxyribonuclease NucA/NucB domain-containing protein n=1 Tax=Agrocybe chaxingu TaxID=84603 RepID=A0A9W8MU43_9AGAR|nr:hypothetical protein NLJ89_g8423 [Agrocybe chaxingu]